MYARPGLQFLDQVSESLVHARISGDEFDPNSLSWPHIHHPRQSTQLLAVRRKPQLDFRKSLEIEPGAGLHIAPGQADVLHCPAK